MSSSSAAPAGVCLSRKRVVIVGLGQFAQGLASLLQRSGGHCTYEVVLGSRRPATSAPPSQPPPKAAGDLGGLPPSLSATIPASATFLPNVSAPVLSIADALKGAHIIILALPAGALPPVVEAHARELAAADALVDVSNPSPGELATLRAAVAAAEGKSTSSATWHDDNDYDDNNKNNKNIDAIERSSRARSLSAAECVRELLAGAVEGAGGNVCKAFNTLSSYALIHGDPLTDAMRSVVCSDDPPALVHVRRLGRAMGVDLRAVRSLSYARKLELRHGQLFPEWVEASVVMMVTFVLVLTYSAVRYNGFGGTGWISLLLFIRESMGFSGGGSPRLFLVARRSHTTLDPLPRSAPKVNKAVAWAALWGMGYAYLPGLIVTVWQLCVWKRSVRVPRWLKRWLDMRKQLGLLSLLATLLHLSFSLFLWMPSYFPKLFQHSSGPTGALVLVPRSEIPAAAPAAATLALAAGASTVATSLPPAPPPPLGGAALLKPPPSPLLDEYGILPKSSKPDALHGHSGWVVAPIPPPSVDTPPAVVSLPTDEASGVVVATGSAITLASKLNWMGELSTLLGVLSGFGMALTGMTSAPSITPKMGWREWRLAQSRLGWVSVVLATAHVLVLGAPAWIPKKHTWPKGIPTITLISTAPMMALLAVKLALSIPPLSLLVSKARRSAPPSADAPSFV